MLADLRLLAATATVLADVVADTRELAATATVLFGTWPADLPPDP
jgi:hypothetical protein